MPVSLTVTAISDWPCSASGISTSLPGRPMRRLTAPSAVNLNALLSRLLAICSSLLPSVRRSEGRPASMSSVKPRPFSSATCANVRRNRCARSASARSSITSSILPASTLDRSRMSLIRCSRLLPASWMIRADSICSSSRLPVPFSARLRDRISRLFSGVRSSCDMLARNSDLYWLARASSAALSAVSCCRSSSTYFCRFRLSVFSRSSSLDACSSSACTRSSSSEAISRADCSSSSVVFARSASLLSRSTSFCWRITSSDTRRSSACSCVCSSRSCVLIARLRFSRVNATIGSSSSSSCFCCAVSGAKPASSSTPIRVSR